MNNFSKDFDRYTVKTLAKQGIYIIGATWLPDANGSYIGVGAERGYQLDNNGQGQIKTYMEVLKMAVK